MNKKSLYKISTILSCFIITVVFSLLSIFRVYAEDTQSGIGMSPLNNSISLNPGETYTGKFTIVNPSSNNTNFNYEIYVQPFFVTEDYNIYYAETGDYNQIINWITIENSNGTLAPNDSQEIYYKINVPLSAPAGGQYAAITVTSDDKELDEKGNVKLNVSQAMAHLLYADVSGKTIHSGEILETSVPSFLFSGKISGTSTVKNNGNVHEEAKYKLQVFPLFSNEEIYTNEEKPDERSVLPERTLINTTSWDNTPSIGIYNVLYTVEFDGNSTQVKKMVIICPIWLLAIIIFVLLLIIFWIIAKARSKKKK